MQAAINQSEMQGPYQILERIRGPDLRASGTEVQLSAGTETETSSFNDLVRLHIVSFLECRARVLSPITGLFQDELDSLSPSFKIDEIRSELLRFYVCTLPKASDLNERLAVNFGSESSSKDRGIVITRPSRPGNAERDFEWFVDNQSELAQYGGKFVAVFEGKVVGSGRTMKDAYDSTTKLNLPRRPLLALVPEEAAQAY